MEMSSKEKMSNPQDIEVFTVGLLKILHLFVLVQPARYRSFHRGFAEDFAYFRACVECNRTCLGSATGAGTGRNSVFQNCCCWTGEVKDANVMSALRFSVASFGQTVFWRRSQPRMNDLYCISQPLLHSSSVV